MKPFKANLSDRKQIRGTNFYGSIQREGETLKLQVTQFGKGGNLYHKQFKRFLIFKNIDDLFQEFIQNHKIQISDQNTLIIPVNVIYKEKTFELKIQLPLGQRKFNSQEQRIQDLLKTMERMNKHISEIQLKQEFNIFKPQLIKFKGDQSNKRLHTFQVSPNKKTIKMLASNQHTCFNHHSTLNNKGIYFFKVKIIKTQDNCIFFGICTNEVKSKIDTNLFTSPFFMGLYLQSGGLWMNGNKEIVASGYTIVEGKSVIKVEIDMNNKTISWFHNQTMLYCTEIAARNIYPMIALHTFGDMLEFLHQ